MAAPPIPAGPLFLPLVAKQPPVLLCNDVEDNDVPAQAQPLNTLGAACRGSFQDDPAGEDDYYLVEVGAGNTLVVELTDMDAGADYDVILYDAALQERAKSNQGGNTPERLVYTSPSAGSLYLRVRAYTKSAAGGNTYILRVTRS